MIELFGIRPHKDGNIFCRLCKRRFRQWNGTAAHGLKHEREGRVLAKSGKAAGLRYLFYIRPGRHEH